MRFQVGLLLAICTSPLAYGHFFFLLPPASDHGPARAVLSDTPEPDPQANPEVGLRGKYWVLPTNGERQSVTAAATPEGWLALEVVPGARGVGGTIEYGVVLRGQAEPTLIVHHPHLTLSESHDLSEMPALTAQQPLELVAVRRSGGIAFVVGAGGKAVASVEVVVYLPGEKRPRAVKTDATGCTPVFEVEGSYAARVSQLEPRSGEYQGRTYKQVRHYATLVVRHTRPK